MSYTDILIANKCINAYGYDYNNDKSMNIYRSEAEAIKGYCNLVGINLSKVEPKDSFYLNKRLSIYRYEMTDFDDKSTISFSQIFRDGKLVDLLSAYNIPYITLDYSKLDNEFVYRSIMTKIDKKLDENKDVLKYTEFIKLPIDNKFMSNRIASTDIVKIIISNDNVSLMINRVSSFLKDLNDFCSDNYHLYISEEFNSDENSVTFLINLFADPDIINSSLVYRCNRLPASNSISNSDYELQPRECNLECSKGFRKTLVMSKNNPNCMAVCKNYIMTQLISENAYMSFMNESINAISNINKLINSINITVDKNGDIIIDNKEIDMFDSHFKRSTKLLAVYKKSNDIPAIKNELCKIYYMAKCIELYHLQPTSNPDERKKQEKLLDLRSVMLNAFNTYLSYVIEHERDFDFDSYFNNSKYGKSYKINVEGFGKLAKKIIKIFI